MQMRVINASHEAYAKMLLMLAYRWKTSMDKVMSF